MGGAVSAGESNDELVDNLVDADYVKTPEIAGVFRAVDRAEYYLRDHRESAYKDLAWKHGNIHLSAPCIYAEVMESLKLKAGMSFLNLGSGTGYLSTLAGLILGPYGINHGVEYHHDVMEYSKERLENYKGNNVTFDEYELCEPQFTEGNCLLLNSGCRLYDRVYCGAACPPEHENYMKNLLTIGGVLVMPLNDQITRKAETLWETKSVLPVSFASLIVPSKEKNLQMVDLPEATVMTLQEICRVMVRRILRTNIRAEHPNIGVRRRKPKKPKQKPRRQRRINIIPMSMGMMVMGQFEDSESDSGSVSRSDRGQDEDESAEIEERERRRRELREEILGEVRDSESDDAHSMPELLRQMQRRHNMVLATRRERQQRLEQEEQEILPLPDDSDDDGFDMSPKEFIRKPNGIEKKDNEDVFNSLIKDASPPSGSSASPISAEDMEVDMSETSGAIPITNAGRRRCSSNASVSTSATSGIGTCSSVDESLELDLSKDIQTPGAITEEASADFQEIKFSHDSIVDCPLPGKVIEQNDGQKPDHLNGSGGDKGAQTILTNQKTAFASVTEEFPHEEIPKTRSAFRTPPKVSIDATPLSETMEEEARSDSSEEHGMECADLEEVDEKDNCEPDVTFKQCFMEKIELLPVPVALKQYLMFYRT